MQETKEEKRERIKDYYNSRTPIFIITKSDSWISGYIIEEPMELFFNVLDWKQNKPIKIFYSSIHIDKPFEGDYSKLPLPDYIRPGETSKIPVNPQFAPQGESIFLAKKESSNKKDSRGAA